MTQPWGFTKQTNNIQHYWPRDSDFACQPIYLLGILLLARHRHITAFSSSSILILILRTSCHLLSVSRSQLLQHSSHGWHRPPRQLPLNHVSNSMPVGTCTPLAGLRMSVWDRTLRGAVSDLCVFVGSRVRVEGRVCVMENAANDPRSRVDNIDTRTLLLT